MTAQISDTFIFRGKRFELIGIEGGELFSPKSLGMEPEMIHTACYRGFYATYRLSKNSLILTKLTINDASSYYPSIDGVEPDLDEYESIAVYSSLKYVIPFTGKIRLARGFIEEFYIHMGYQKATAFKEVYDITIKKGIIIEVKDRSADVEKKRAAFKKHYESEDLIGRIDMAFSMDLEFE